ncbi:MAG: alpha/beta fold hydrolase [Bacteroidota bacterium]
MRVPVFLRWFLLIAIPIALLRPAVAQQQYVHLRAFPLENGSLLSPCDIGYRTFGVLSKDRSNAILFPTWLGGVSADLESLLGSGRLIDTTKYFVVAVDAFGDGVSSSPSTSSTQPGERFPQVSITDMVHAEKILLDTLGVPALAAVVGGSMGALQALEWAVRYPAMMQAIVAYVGTPRCTSADLVLWRTELQAIQDGRRCGYPDSAIARRVGMVNALAIQSPAYRSRTTPADSTEEFIESYVRAFRRRFHADDWALQVRAIMGQDIGWGLRGDVKEAAARIRAKVFLIVSLQDHIVNPGPAMDLAAILGARLLVLDNDCGHLAPSCEFERFSREVREFLDQSTRE